MELCPLYTPLCSMSFLVREYHYSLRWFTDLFSPKIRMFARIVAFHMHIIIVIMSSRSVQNAIAFSVRALLWAFKHSSRVSHCLYSGLEFNLFWSLINFICNRLLVESRPAYYSHIYALNRIDIHTCHGITFDLIIKQGCLYSWYCLVSDSMSDLSMRC